MLRLSGPKGRFAVPAVLAIVFCLFFFMGPHTVTSGHVAFTTPQRDLGHSSQSLLTGHAIAPKLGNATAK